MSFPCIVLEAFSWLILFCIVQRTFFCFVCCNLYLCDRYQCSCVGTRLHRQFIPCTDESQRHLWDVSHSMSHVAFCFLTGHVLGHDMLLPDGKDHEENNSKVYLDVTGQTNISDCSLILCWAKIVCNLVFSQDQEQATETRLWRHCLPKKSLWRWWQHCKAWWFCSRDDTNTPVVLQPLQGRNVEHLSSVHFLKTDL